MALWAAAFSESSADPYVKSGCIDLNNPPISSLLTGGGGPGTFCRGAFWVSGARLESRRALPAYHGRLGQSRGLSWWATWRARNPLNLGRALGLNSLPPPPRFIRPRTRPFLELRGRRIDWRSAGSCWPGGGGPVTAGNRNRSWSAHILLTQVVKWGGWAEHPCGPV